MTLRALAALALMSVATVASVQAADPVQGLAEAFARSVSGGVAAGTAPIYDNQPRWETVPPQSREACLAASGGVIDPAFVRCRRGRQELVRIDTRGVRQILSERPIPQ